MHCFGKYNTWHVPKPVVCVLFWGKFSSLQYYSVLQMCYSSSTKYYSSTSLYYKVLLLIDPWHMKRHLQCAEQQESSSNFTKYCAWHAKRISWLIRITYETSFTLRGATGIILQLHQILPLPGKMNLMIDSHHIWNINYNARSTTTTTTTTAPATTTSTATATATTTTTTATTTTTTTTRDPTFHIRDSRSEIRDPRFEIRDPNPRFEIRDPRSEIRAPRFEIEIRDPRFEIRDPRFEIPLPTLGVRDSRSEIRDSRSEIRDYTTVRVTIVTFDLKNLVGPGASSARNAGSRDFKKNKKQPEGTFNERWLGGGNSNIFYFHPDPWGNDTIWRAYLLNGLVQPPIRWWCFSFFLFFFLLF